MLLHARHLFVKRVREKTKTERLWGKEEEIPVYVIHHLDPKRESKHWTCRVLKLGKERRLLNFLLRLTFFPYEKIVRVVCLTCLHTQSLTHPHHPHLVTRPCPLGFLCQPLLEFRHFLRVSLSLPNSNDLLLGTRLCRPGLSSLQVSL